MDVYLRPDLFYFLQGRVEADKLAGIDLRTSLGVGLGHKWTGGHNLDLNLGLGYSFVREALSSGAENTEGTLLVTLDLDRDISPNLTVEHRLLAYPQLSTGDYRLQAQTTFSSKIAKDLSFTLGFLNKYDSNPPPGFVKSDLTITSGIRKDF